MPHTIKTIIYSSFLKVALLYSCSIFFLKSRSGSKTKNHDLFNYNTCRDLKLKFQKNKGA